MKLNSMLLSTVAAASVLVLSSGAQAAVVSFGALPAAAIANPPAFSTTGSVQENTTGSTPNVKRSPWDSAGSVVAPNAATSYYTVVEKDSSALYKFTTPQTKLSFVWGSPDTFNLLKFFLGGGQVDSLAVVSGDIITPASFGANSALATITGVTFDAVEFSSSNFSFEYANIVAAVPLPAAGLLMIGALAGLGVVARRKSA